ncbi:alpha-amylase family glycosyl hydrolase, partial [Limosilactobacillus fermentum]
DFYILGEIWHTSQAWLNGDEFSGVMNYSYTTAILHHFINHELSSNQMIEQLSTQLMKYRDQTNQMMFNVLDSHDTARIMTLAHNNVDLVQQTFAFTFLQPGVPSIYYGTEYGMTGENDPDCRKPMNWHPDGKAKQIFAFFQQLNELRRQNWQLLSEGELSLQVLKNGLIEVRRQFNGRELVGLFNTSNQTVTIDGNGQEVLSQNYEGRQLTQDGFLIYRK